jgi:uncharacterized protein (DUF1501 family)
MLGAAASLSVAGKARAQESDSRFVVIVLRGAMDGLNVVVPYGDPDLKTHRASLLLPEPGTDQGLGDLGGFFGLHPSLKATHALFQANDVLHFEAQDMLEIGAPTRMTSGWLNRIAALLPENPNCDMAFNVGSTSPLILHGPTPVASWDPFHPRPRVSSGFYETIAAMQGADPIAGAEVTDGLRERQYIDRIIRTVSYDGIAPGFPRLARAAAALLAEPDGPRLAELELDGWDTHSGQPRRLSDSLVTLDQGIAVLRAGLAPVWSKTAILVITEFGRTVRVNGTQGTDHGTGTAAFLIGGAIAGGKVRADWPGLKPSQLFENRDLQQTLDIRAVAKGVLGPHFGITPAQLETIFPNSSDIAAATGLLRA